MPAEDDSGITDPLVAGIADGVAAGYSALEHVLEGVRQSASRRADGSERRGYQAPAGRSRALAHARDADVAGARTALSEIVAGGRQRLARLAGDGGAVDVDDFAGFFAELLDRAGEVVQQVAGTVREIPRGGESAESEPRLFATAAPGSAVDMEFRIWNTGATAFRDIQLTATDLVSGAGRIDAGAVVFKRALIERVRPGGSSIAAISIAVPGDAAPGTYRGVIQASPGDAWAVVELVVVDAVGGDASG